LIIFVCWKQVKWCHRAESMWVVLLSKTYHVMLFLHCLMCVGMRGYWMWITIHDVWLDSSISSTGVGSKQWCVLPHHTAGQGGGCSRDAEMTGNEQFYLLNFNTFILRWCSLKWAHTAAHFFSAFRKGALIITSKPTKQIQLKIIIQFILKTACKIHLYVQSWNYISIQI